MNSTLDKYKFTPSQLRKRYITALGLIALLIIASQVLIQISLMSNSDSSRIINIAGRQRMLSQKITKSALALSIYTDEFLKKKYVEELTITLELWSQSDMALKEGSIVMGITGKNSPEIIEMYREINDSYNIIIDNVNRIIDKYNNNDSNFDENITSILIQEPIFLQGMDEIVFQYDFQAANTLNKIKQLEIIILIITFALLFFELFFIFLPIEKELELTFMEVYRKEEFLDNLASYDEMTGLYNKRMGIIMLEQEFEKSKRTNEPLTVCFIDADGLKTINDTLGHKIGDEYIKTIANAILKGLRKSETGFRYGGDEFVLIIRGNIDDAKLAVSRILSNITANDTYLITHSISTGYAQLNDHNVLNVDELIKIADADMYKNKKIKKRTGF